MRKRTIHGRFGTRDFERRANVFAPAARRSRGGGKLILEDSFQTIELKL
jgi:hypothetical protein